MPVLSLPSPGFEKGTLYTTSGIALRCSPAPLISTRICDLLGAIHPIVRAPMSGGIAAADLTAAISEAGGFGLIGVMTTGGTDFV